MATTYTMSPITLLIQFFTNVGIVLNGGFVNVYQAGSVSTPVTTYTDSTGTVANSNPIALSSAGRLVAAGTGAPVAVWVAQSTPHKMVVTDSAGNFIISIDNLIGLNDLSGLFTSLASPLAGAGADLVANAVKSYYNFATIRAAPIPAPVSGQTVIVIAAGQITESDLRGGAFIWDSTLTQADDNYNYLVPTANAAPTTQAGRYKRIVQPYLPSFDSGNPTPQGGYAGSSFQPNLTGMNAPVIVNCTYYIVGVTAQSAFCVFVFESGGIGVSNSTTMTITVPTAIAPVGAVAAGALMPLEDNGTVAVGQVSVSGTTMSFGKVPGAIGGFTASGNKGIPGPLTIIYPLS
jgi:hypothetical protein